MASPPDELIEIRVPTTDGAEIVATGYPVAPGKILTASHVLHPKDRDEKKPIEVRWYNQLGPANAYRPISRIAWDGRVDDECHKDLDVALLECPFPDDAADFVPLRRMAPQVHAPWDSEGFAKAVETGDNRPKISLRGTLQRSATKDRQFDVNAEPAPKLKEGWAGISGCPVFVGDIIVGVIVSVYGNFGNAKLRAVKIAWLLDETRFPKFCKEIGWTRQRECDRIKADYKAWIARELQQCEPLRAFLEKSERISVKGNGDPWDQVAEAVLDLDDESACEILTDAFSQFEGRNDQTAWMAVSRLANRVLPALVDQDDAALVLASKGNAGYGLVEFRCSGRTLTELIMAQHDRRHAIFRPRTPRKGEPPGEPAGQHLIHAGPEMGKASNVATDLKTFDDLLAAQYLNEDDKARYEGDALRAYNKIRLEKESRRLTKYYAIHVEDLEQRPDLRESAETVKAAYPEIVFVQLQRPMACAMRDDKLLADSATLRMLSCTTE